MRRAHLRSAFALSNTAINVTVTPVATAGTYTAHPSVAIFRSDGSVIALRGLTVTYQVTP